MLKRFHDFQDFIGQLVMHRVERFGTPNGDDLDVFDIVDQDVAIELLIVAERLVRHRHAGSVSRKLFEDSGGLDLANFAHQIKRAGFEAEGVAAAKFQIRRIADVAVENIYRLRHQNAEQTIAHGRRSLGPDLDPRSRPNSQPAVNRTKDRGRPIVLAVLLCLQGICLGNDRISARQIENEERSGVDKLRGHRIDFRCGRMVKEMSRLVAPVVEDAVEHETGDIVSHDRHLAGHAEHPIQIFNDDRSVARQRTTSTMGLRQAGAKKCVTVARLWC